ANLLERTYFNQTQVHNLKDLVDRYGSDEFASPFRSTAPPLSLIRDGQPMLEEILARCGFAERSTLHFEFQVAPPKGQGKASHTDLMVCTQTGCMAVEAKWTEPPYETVDEWLKGSSQPGDEGRDNRREVLSGWLSLLQRMTTRSLVAKDMA